MIPLWRGRTLSSVHSQFLLHEQMPTANRLQQKGLIGQRTHDSVQTASRLSCSLPSALQSLLRPTAHCCSCMLQEQTPTEEDAQNRREILQQLDGIVQTGLPDYPGLCIQPYGSYVSGLYCPSGDLDLSIEGTPIDG